MSLKPVLHIQHEADRRTFLEVQVQSYASENTSSKPNSDGDFLCDFVSFISLLRVISYIKSEYVATIILIFILNKFFTVTLKAVKIAGCVFFL